MSFEKCEILAYKIRTDLQLDEITPMTQYALNEYLVKNKIIVKYYSQLLAIDPYEEIINVFGNDGAAIIDYNYKLIVINDLKNDCKHYSNKRWVWTLLHECGHFECGHLNYKDCMKLRCTLYDTFEKEADFFAANVLMPNKAVFKAVDCRRTTPSDCLDSNDLAYLAQHFGVSWSAIINRLDYLGIQDSLTSKRLITTYNQRKAKTECSEL